MNPIPVVTHTVRPRPTVKVVKRSRDLVAHDYRPVLVSEYRLPTGASAVPAKVRQGSGGVQAVADGGSEVSDAAAILGD